MSDDNYILERIRESSLKSTHEEMLKSGMHKALFGFIESDTAKLVQWPEVYRGVPNAILRSGLFGAIARGKRPYSISKPVAALSNIQIMHSGPLLDQADLDVWMQCMHISRTQPLGFEFQISAHPFLKAIGRDTGKSQREWLKESFGRLATSVIELNEKDGTGYFNGHLIHAYGQDTDTGLHHVIINPSIIRLYGNKNCTWVELEERLALSGHPLALWLHGFYVTHANALPYKVETIHKLCGSRSKNVTDFRKDVRKAFALMHAAIGWKGEINSKGLITIERPVSRAQRRHLNAKLPN